MDTVKVTGDKSELFLQFWTPLVIRFHLMCNTGYFEKILRFLKKTYLCWHCWDVATGQVNRRWIHRLYCARPSEFRRRPGCDPWARPHRNGGARRKRIGTWPADPDPDRQWISSGAGANRCAASSSGGRWIRPRSTSAGGPPEGRIGGIDVWGRRRSCAGRCWWAPGTRCAPNSLRVPRKRLWMIPILVKRIFYPVDPEWAAPGLSCSSAFFVSLSCSTMNELN